MCNLDSLSVRTTRGIMAWHLLCFHSFVYAVLIISGCSSIAAVVYPLCSSTDLHVLQEFHESVNSSRLLSWLEHDNCCLWLGVRCNSKGQVVSIDLPSLSLNGAIPPALFNLSALRHVDLSNNSFSGEIPPSIANSLNLAVLDLSHNALLMGPLPLGFPCTLRRLDLSHCAFHGTVPHSITNSTNIRELLLSHNHLSSFASGFNSPLAALQVMDASDNCFTRDSLQFLVNCTRIRHLNLGRNQLQGWMPWQLGELADLEVLQLDDNYLHGVIPHTLGKLSRLAVLSLANNSLDGPFPKAITQCASLWFLSLSGNMLSGNLPTELGNLLYLRFLLLANNRFSGTLPIERQFLMQLEILDVSNNRLEGPFMTGDSEAQPSSLHVGQIASVSKLWSRSIGKFLNFISVGMVSVRRFISYASQTLVFLKFQLRLKFLHCVENTCQRSPRSILLNPVQHYRHLLQKAEPPVDKKSKNLQPFLIGIISGVGVFFSVLFVIVMVIFCRVKVRPWHKRRFGHAPTKLPSLRKFRRESSKVFDPTLASISMRDLVKATDGFDVMRVVGDGGFGLVYSATLADGRTVAVKKLATDSVQGKREFEAEMETLGKIKHPNLVELLAYCKVADDRVLIYEFVQNGSLDAWLHEKTDGPWRLDWNKRLKIARGSARGLCYLHHESNPHIIHRDIKSSNILLGKDFEPKIADFGLARALSPLVSYVSTDAAGTLGYMAPEYTTTFCATKQADVYSFGMLMLELATGRRPNLLLPDKNFHSLARWARHMLQIGHEMDLLDAVFKKAPPPSDQVRTFFGVACDCVSDLPNDRPTMREVNERLSLMG